MKPIRVLLLVAMLAVPVSSCAAVVSSLPTVIAAVTDGVLIVDTIKTFVDGVFRVRPDADLQKKVDQAIARTKVALDAALRIAKGTQSMTQAQVEAAFAEFKIAYADLVALVAPLGVTTGDQLKATPGGLQVPKPMAIDPLTVAGICPPPCYIDAGGAAGG